MIRAAATVVLAAALALLVVVTGVASVSRYASPVMALRAMPWDAVAMERRAEDLLQPNATQAQRLEARNLALAALRHDPTSVTAIRVLGLIADGEGAKERAQQMLAHAAKLSRRDFGVELWLIEDAVSRGDSRTALYHYDIALRTQRSAAAVLFPVLSQALSDPRLIAPFAEMLARKPAWATQFLTEAAQADAIDANFAALLSTMARQGTALDPTVLTVALDRQVARGRLNLAWNLYQSTLGQKAALLRDGGFDGTDRNIPFEWVFAREPDRSSGFGTSALDYVAEAGATGDLAWQTLKLPPGGYRLRARVEPGSGLPPRWKVACLFGRPFIMPMVGNTAASAFEIGPNCPYQRLSLTVDDAAQGDRSAGTVDEVSITPSR